MRHDKYSPNPKSTNPADYADAVTALVAAGERSGAAMWERMAYISDRFGPRPAGSDALADAQDFVRFFFFFFFFF